MGKLTVFLVDDHPLMRNALEAAINAAPDMMLVGQAGTGRDALTIIPTMRPDVILIDLLMPEMSGLELIANLSLTCPEQRLLVFSSLVEKDKILQALQSGALGYLSKDAPREELIEAIRTVGAGEVYLPPKIAGSMMRALRDMSTQKGPESLTQSLTAREQEVFDLLGKGHSDREIAQKLHIAESTVRVHIHHVMNKLNMDTRRGLVVFAAREAVERERR